ncbi:MAG: YggS family pyridoxal phosphate-dependent enzyme [Pseudomonadota bacterium]
MTQITHNLMNIQERIASAARASGRDPASVKLLAVSKKHPAEAILDAQAAGHIHFGENFAAEALDKQRIIDAQNAPAAAEALRWHFIGRIQSNKARQVATHFSWVHSLDRDKIARRLDQFRGPGQPLNVLVQINLSDDSTRSGVPVDEAPAFIERTRALPRLRVRGLMAMAPATDDYDEQAAAFAKVEALSQSLQQKWPDLVELSMGMSGDLEAAIAHGATWVRIGTDVFGKRPVD